MSTGRASRELRSILPWLGAALLWFGIVTPMRADRESRLIQQSRARRDRVQADGAARDLQALRTRISFAMAAACRASADPAALRQRTVAATSGLALAPFTLSVTGGSDGGAAVEAGGARGAVLGLVRRLGDPARGGFLRSATVRDRGARWSASATTGVLDSFPDSIAPPRPNCAGTPDPGPAEARPETTKLPVRLRPGSTPPARVLELPRVTAAPEATPAPPFTLVAFLMSGGKSRVSLRAGDQIRVVSVGDLIEGWRCVSIDRDDGAVFASPAQGRFFVLKPAVPAAH